MDTPEVFMYIHLLFNRIVYKLSRPSDWMVSVYRVHDPNTPVRPSATTACTLPHGVVLGSSFDACSADMFRKKNIRAVVNVTPDVPCFFQNDDASLTPIDYLQIPIDDHERSTFNTHMLQGASAFITSHTGAGGQVLVHCVMGRSRSVCVCCYHLMKQHGMVFEDIYSTIQTLRPQVCVNQNFVHDLAREFPHDTGLQRFMATMVVGK